MTEPDPRDAHLSADTLADLQEGLLDADGEAGARRHLEACGTCRHDLALLTGTPALLAAAAEVGPLPELVAHRLDRALADAAAEQPAPTTAAAATVTPLAAPRRSPRGMQVLQVAAAAVLVLGIGALGVSFLHDAGGSNDTATSAADSAGGAASRVASTPVTASGRDWSQQSLQADAVRLADGTLSPPVALYAARDGAAGGDRSSESGANAPEAAAPSASAKALADAPASALADPGALADCVANLATGAGDIRPLVVDLAEYEGKPAGVFVFPSPDDPARLDVFVVAPDCPPGGLLYYASVPRS